ncbi:MAG TPA: UPF0182 family protein [Dehalococcoidia bacterium]|nr:UPF0182 family protein [Dehalococcoidia bacterium]
MASGDPPREDREGLGPPPIPFRVGREQLPSFHAMRWLVVVAVLIGLFTLASIFKGLYADFLWFDSLGYAAVYNTMLITKTVLFFVGALLFLGFIAGNLWLARRLAPVGLEESFIAEVEPATLKRIVTIVAVAGSIFLAIVFGSVASSEWETWLRLVNGASFGGSDPAFHMDPGFYMFTLPGLWAILDWLLGLTIVTLLAVIGVYAFVISLQNFEVRLSRAIKAHVGCLGLLLLLVYIVRYRLDIFSLAITKNGVVEGATYTDIHARIPGYYILMVFAVAAGACIVWSIFRRRLIVAGAGVGAWIVAAIALLGIYPAAVQRLNVDPNELAKEQPYIQRNIDGTRTAFNLQAVDLQPFQASSDITRQTLSQDQATIDNIRLWDPRFEIQTYKQQQEIQQYYVFDDVDVDRYALNGRMTEVTLGARELSQDSLQPSARTWVNVHTRYTHGYGAVMNPVNKVDVFGLPAYNLQNIPPQGEPAIEQPRIYYGQQTKEYEIVGAKQAEIDFEDNTGTQQETRYNGNGGVGIGSFFRRLVYAWEFGDTNLLISGQITGQSRLLYRRTLKDRISHIAPFLTLDNDPYLVIVDGKLYWIQDAFTTSDSFPYSEDENGINYIRNSVKIVVDAYTGDVTFYLVDPSDPVAKTYQKIYPTLFKPFDAMPASLRSHIRYPEDLFRIQSDVYRTYHMTDPSVFYGKQDLWATPQEGTGGSAKDLDPYYLIMRLPGEQRQEFVLIRPFTPANKPNAIALMAARMDAPNYGQLQVFRFPSGQVIAGPVQVQSSIDAQPEISQRLTLLNQQGSHVQRGNLLMIPINQSYIYVEPVYLQADQNPKPAVVAVIVYAAGKVFMEPSLNQALAAAVGEITPTYSFSSFAASAATAAAQTNNSGGNGQPTPTATPAAGASPAPASTTPPNVAAPPATSVTPTATDIPGLIREASDANAQAQQRLRNGDFAGYGEEEARLQAALNRLGQLIAQPTASPAPR